MPRRVLTVAEMEQIHEHIEDGLSDRQIARALKCRRSRIRELRNAEFAPNAETPIHWTLSSPPGPRGSSGRPCSKKWAEALNSSASGRSGYRPPQGIRTSGST